MSRLPTGISSGLLTSGSNTIYTVPDSTNIITTNLTLTNLEAAIGEVEVYIDRGTSRLIQILKIPSGNGKAVRVNLLEGVSLNASDSLTITADKTNINYDFSGYVVT